MLSKSFEFRHPLYTARQRRQLLKRPNGSFLAVQTDERETPQETLIERRETTLLDAHEARQFARTHWSIEECDRAWQGEEGNEQGERSDMASKADAQAA